MCVCVCVCIHTYINIYKYIYTYICTYILSIFIVFFSRGVMFLLISSDKSYLDRTCEQEKNSLMRILFPRALAVSKNILPLE